MVRQQRQSGGFTLVELLISLSLSAILLAGFAVVIHGALFSYEQNTNSTALDHVGRSIMERMTQEIRSSSNLDCSSNLLSIYPVDPAEPDEIRYRLEDGVFYYDQVNGGNVTSNILIGAQDSVTVQWFSIDLILNGSTATLANVSLGLQVGDTTRTIKTSASPRINRSSL